MPSVLPELAVGGMPSAPASYTNSVRADRQAGEIRA